MDARHFDAVTRVLSAADTRRRLLGLLAAVPLLEGLLGLPDADEAVAKDRRRRRKQRHKQRKHSGKHKQKGCKPKGKGAVCAGKCGSVKSKQTCGKAVSCGPCDCPTPCAACFVCDPATRTCVVDPDQVGDTCGSPGQVCAADGTCACTDSSCPSCTTCEAGVCAGCDGCCDGDTCVSGCGDCRVCDDGQCQECPGCCDGETCVEECPACTTCMDGQCVDCPGCCDDGTCVAACPACTVCDGGQCTACPGCCDGAGTCQDGDTNAACGADGETCEACTGQDACVGGACVCQPGDCAAQGKTCGNIDDGCGDTLNCGTCANPLPICTNNVCGACSSDTQCGTSQVCCAGSCVALSWANQVTFGARGSGPSEFNHPSGVAIAPDGLTVWVADFLNHRIAVWTRPDASSTAWTNQIRFGAFGSGPGQFNRPMSVAVSPDGRTVWVADAENARIAVWTRPNASSTAWTNQTTFGSAGSGPSQFAGLRGMAVAPDGLTAWIADFGNDRIAVWSRPNTSSTVWTNQTTFGALGNGPGQFEDPYGVAVSPDGLTAWVADFLSHRIAVWTRPDASSTAWTNQTTFGARGGGLGDFNRPMSVAVSPDGLTAWVADYSNNRISVWTRPDATSTSWTNQTTFGAFGSEPSQFGNPMGLAVAPDGRTVWVADDGNFRISVWSGLACPA